MGRASANSTGSITSLEKMFVTVPSNVGKITSNQASFIDKVWFHLHQKVNSRTTNAVYTIWCMVHSEFR